jgi:hypothetical protein
MLKLLPRLLLRLRAADARDAALAAACGATVAVPEGAWRRWVSTGEVLPAGSKPPASAGAARQDHPKLQPQPQPQQDEAAAGFAAELSAVGLSHSAVLAVVGWHPYRSQLSQAKILGRARMLQDVFGKEITNRILVM